MLRHKEEYKNKKVIILSYFPSDDMTVKGVEEIKPFNLNKLNAGKSLIIVDDVSKYLSKCLKKKNKK